MRKNVGIMIGILIAAVIAGGFFLYRQNQLDFEGYYIVNNKKLIIGTPDFSKDVHRVEKKDGGVIYTNYPYGYKIAFPEDAEFNLDTSSIITKAVIGGDVDFTITKEWSPYEDSVQYVKDYTNRYMMDPKFIEENKLTMHRDEIIDVGNYRIQYIIFTRQTPANGAHKKNT